MTQILWLLFKLRYNKHLQYSKVRYIFLLYSIAAFCGFNHRKRQRLPIPISFGLTVQLCTAATSCYFSVRTRDLKTSERIKEWQKCSDSSEIEICYEQKVMTLIWRVDVGSKLTMNSKHGLLDGWLRFSGRPKIKRLCRRVEITASCFKVESILRVSWRQLLGSAYNSWLTGHTQWRHAHNQEVKCSCVKDYI